MAKNTRSSNVRKNKHSETRRLKFPNPKKWLDHIKDDHLRLAIPVGTRFQAVLPEWTNPPGKTYPCNGDDVDDSRWLGTRIWPISGRSPVTKGDYMIGKGRPDTCVCVSPGSAECVKRHVSNKRIQLQLDLGCAFWRWKFDEMGEEVSNLWNSEEQQKFESLVKMNPVSKCKSFLKPAMECLLAQSGKTIVSYYLNVYIPRQISMQTRSGCIAVDTDNGTGETPHSKGSRKRRRADNPTSSTSKYVKTWFLTGRR